MFIKTAEILILMNINRLKCGNWPVGILDLQIATGSRFQISLYLVVELATTNEPHHMEAAEAGKESYSYANNVILNNAVEGFETYVVDSGYCIDTTNELIREYDCI